MKIQARPKPRLRCPFCHDTVPVQDARICPACSSAQHVACDLAHGGCAICVVYPLRHRPRRRRAPRRDPSGGARGYGAGALALALLAFASAAPLLIGDQPNGVPVLAAMVCLSSASLALCFLCAGLWSLLRAKPRSGPNPRPL